MVEDNNLLTLIECVSIYCFIDQYFHRIRYGDFSWLEGLKNINATQPALSLKQKAVVYDILAMGDKKKEEYRTIALKSYVAYTSNLINTVKNSTENEDIDENDILASFIRSYIYRNVNNNTWNQIIEKIYEFIKHHQDTQDIFLHDITISFLLLVAKDQKFQDILSIYHDLLVKADDYNLLEWVFNKNIANPLFIHTDFFNTYEDKNNLKNLTAEARKKIQASDKCGLMKDLAKKSFLSHYDGIYKVNNCFCLPIPIWISETLNHDDKNNYYQMIYPISDKEEPLNIKLDKGIQEAIEQIKNLDNLEEIIKIIITIDTSEFIKHNMHVFDWFVGPNSIIVVDQRKLITGEVYNKDSNDILYIKLNCLYQYIFEQIPIKAVNLKMVQNLLDKWLIVKTEFHNVLKNYFCDVLDATTPNWQKVANINQIVLLVEPILGAINPNEYTKFWNNSTNGITERRGFEYKKYLENLLKKKNSSEAKFLLDQFIHHRIKVAHGKTFNNFGNCYFILQGIIKIFYMDYSNFNLPKV